MIVRCINRPFQDLKENVWREVGDEWEGTPERVAEINRAGYGVMAEAVEREAEAPWWESKTRAELFEIAFARGIDAPSKATKAQLAALIDGE